MTDTAAPLTLPGVLLHAARNFGDSPAIVAADATLSYAQLAADVDAAAYALHADGLAPGDRVAIWAPNSPQWIIATLAIHVCGGIVVPMNTRFKTREARWILQRSGARRLLTVTGFAGLDPSGLLGDPGLADLQQVLLLEGEDGVSQQWPTFVAAAGAPSADTSMLAACTVTPGDTADIIFTSGTTGQPKGVMSTHEQNVRVYRTWIEFVGLRPRDRYLIVNPFFHTFGYKAGWLACLLAGATIYPVARFDAAEVLRQIERECITVLPGPPTLYQSLLDHEARDSADLSSLRLAVTGAASVPPMLIRRMREELGFQQVVTAYGLTESTGTVTICPPGSSDETVATRCGVPIPGVEVRCVDQHGTPCSPGEPGEVLVRGYNVMHGYFQDDEATRQAIDADGWLHTGDIGILDDAGFLRITDRSKDVFIVGGFNCYPAEIERILSEYPDVAQSAVIGVEDARMGQVGKAFVVLRRGAASSAAQIMAWCRDNMANYKVPRHVEIVEALPTNATGKVQKYLLPRLSDQETR